MDYTLNEIQAKCKIYNNRRFYKEIRFSHIVWNYFNPDNKWEKGYSIHHKDGNSLNDDISNLQKMIRNEHNRYHGLGERNAFYNGKHTEETKRNQSKRVSGKNNPLYGVHRYGSSNPMYGRHHSEESKEKNRQAQLGKKQSPETIAKRVAKNTGKKRTPEQIERLKKGQVKATQTKKEKKNNIGKNNDNR